MSFIEEAWKETDQNIVNILKKRLAVGNDDSFLVFNAEDIAKKFEFWTEKFPRVRPFFAMKANHTEFAIKTMASLGSGFDCASKTEIKKILELGVDPSRIIYANPAKQHSHLKFAKENKVEKMTFDNIDELQKIRLISPNAKLVLRIRYDAKKVFMTFGEKFGCDPKTEAPALIRKCQEFGLNLIGICFHAGCQIEEPEVFSEAIKAVRQLFDFSKTIGLKLNFVDIGGGFCGENMSQVESCAKFINEALEELFPDPSIEVIAEPGMFFVRTCMKLLCCVHSKRVQRDDEGKSQRFHYFLNNGNFTSFLGNHLFKIPALYKPFYSETISKESETYESTFWGHTCDSTDKIFEGISSEKNIGDWLIFKAMGAYGLCRATDFNGFPKPDVISLK